MSFWGMSNAGKEAGGFAREQGAWNSQQFRDWLARANAFSDRGNALTDQALDFWRQQMNEGIGSPDQIRQTGQQISPWVQPAIDSRRGRLNEIEALQRGLKPADEVAGEMSGRLDDQAASITGNFDDIQGTIDSTTGRQFGREEQANRDIVGNIRDTAIGMTGAVNDTFGGLRTDNAASAGRLRGDGDAAFSSMLSDIELLKPGSEASQARTARSFAPQTADTLARLRRSGVDPNGLQAQAVLRQVESARSRAVDDAAADGNLQYTDRKNNVRGNQLDYNAQVERGRLGNEMNLGVGQVDRTNSIADGAGSEYRAETRTNAGNMNSIDGTRADATIQNLDSATTRSMDLTQRRNALTAMQRDMNREDAAGVQGVLREQNNEDLIAGGLIDDQFDRGMSYTGANTGIRANAAGQVGQAGRDATSNAFSSANTAQGFGQQATQNYNTAFDREAANAGWGTRLLGGLAAGALNLVAPGVGSAFGGVLQGGQQQRPAQQQGNSGGPGGAYGGGQGQNGSFSWSSLFQMPRTRTPQQPTNAAAQQRQQASSPGGWNQVFRPAVAA